MNEQQKFPTREAWLIAAVEQLRPIFKAQGYDIPVHRVTTGWPSSRGTSEKKRCAGEYWTGEASKDGIPQIFISPWLDEAEVTAEYGVLAILAHEVVHAVVGIKAQHGAVFRKCAIAIGLEGKMTSTFAGEALRLKFVDVAAALGPFPHSKLDPKMSPKKKQTTRMIKAECMHDDCGFIVRLSNKWLTEVGAPHCPRHGEMFVEKPADETIEGEETED